MPLARGLQRDSFRTQARTVVAVVDRVNLSDAKKLMLLDISPATATEHNRVLAKVLSKQQLR